MLISENYIHNITVLHYNNDVFLHGREKYTDARFNTEAESEEAEKEDK